MAYSPPWTGSGTAPSGATGLLVDIASGSPDGKTPATSVTLQNTGSAAIFVSFDAGANFDFSVANGTSHEFRGAILDQMHVRSAGGTETFQWVAYRKG